jgi:hypothetical protein
MEFPLPWERLLWSERPWWPPQARHALTDFRIVSVTRDQLREIALQDIREVQSSRSLLDRLTGSRTLLVFSRAEPDAPFVIRHVRAGAQLAALLELVAGLPQLSLDATAVSGLLAWQPAFGRYNLSKAFAALFLAAAVFGLAIALHGHSSPVTYAPDDPVYPAGVKREREAIVRFMETQVMPWARSALGPLKGGAAHVTCQTCHGIDPESRDWAMPAVAALPEPDVRLLGLEIYPTAVDAQLRNAIYGYRAEPDNQAKAAYMREVVMPGMARLLRRSSYDFTRSYEYNRTRSAFGCYHCHRVK